jgi:predicted Zn finger-like uncharacterized protein
MIIECDRCYARYRYDESRLGDKVSKKVRCTKCLAIFEIFNENARSSSGQAAGPRPGDETVLRLADDDTAPKREPATKKSLAPPRRAGSADLKMPQGFKVSLAVIAGPESGRIFALEKPRVVIGRHDADINVDDPEISRSHAAIELSGDKAALLDLGSTNGTFVGEEQIQECPIENQTEFSIGGSTLMLIFTPKA